MNNFHLILLLLFAIFLSGCSLSPFSATPPSPTPRPTFVLARGAYDAPVDSVGPTTPEAVLSFPEDYPRNRLGLARWLVHPQNPLTARVAVNRVWQMYFETTLINGHAER